MGQGEVKEVVLDELRPYRHCGELKLHFKLEGFKQIKDYIFRREFCPVLSPLAHIWASFVAHCQESACSAGDRFNPWVRKIPWRRKWQPTPVFLTEESHGQRSLAVYSPWGCKESDMTEQLTLHF